MILLMAGIFLLLLSGFLAPLARQGSRMWDLFSLGSGLAGIAIGTAATILCLLEPGQDSLVIGWPAVDGLLALKIDSLNALFLLPAFFIAGSGLIYGLGYQPIQGQPGSAVWVRCFYPLLTAGIILLLSADNAMVFLIGWELMALSGYFLVVTDRHDQEVRKAAFLYLSATHTSTLTLFALFALLGEQSCLHHFPAAGTLSPGETGTAVFLLALFGFGFKAGIMPLHIWLPRAHAAAPSHVSALMSGVMIKTGIYGLVRTLSFFESLPSWWGWLVFGLGLLSGILGVVFAIAQHDLKRLLAYHSVENIGIILIGIGIGLIGKSSSLPGVALLGMAGGLLHVINHGLFKALLFFSAGSMIKATSSRQLSSFGGLLKPMPVTGFFFLGGSIAICGLPPLNGFVSEWLIYLGLYQGGIANSMLPALLIALPGLAMIGGLALLCFAKVFGLSFLGMPRRHHGGPTESPGSMLLPMGLLFSACLWIGILPQTIIPLLQNGATIPLGTNPDSSAALSILAPTRSLSLAALLFCILILPGVLNILFGRWSSNPPGRSTWGCGFSLNLPRAQYTASSFAQFIMGFFHWALRTKTHGTPLRSLLPTASRFSSHTADPVLDITLLPVISVIGDIAVRLRRIIQHGNIGIYLLYIALTVIFLLVIAVFR